MDTNDPNVSIKSQVLNEPVPAAINHPDSFFKDWLALKPHVAENIEAQHRILEMLATQTQQVEEQEERHNELATENAAIAERCIEEAEQYEREEAMLMNEVKVLLREETAFGRQTSPIPTHLRTKAL